MKKSLLESCPYLILIIIPAIRSLVSGTYGARWLLWLVPAGFIGFYGYFAWHGGVGWNMRYFNPALPFLAILASHELLRVLNSLPVRRWLFWAGVATLWVTLVAVFFYLHIRPDLQETVVLNGGLLLAALLLICQVVGMMPAHALSTAIRPIFAALLVLALVWSSALTVGFDYLHSATIRAAYLRASRDIEPHIQERALIVTYQPNVVWGLLDSGKEPIIARYLLGTPSDAVKLIVKAMDQRPVYWQDRDQDRDMFTVPVFDALRTRGIVARAVLEADDSRPYRLFRFHAASERTPRK